MTPALNIGDPVIAAISLTRQSGRSCPAGTAGTIADAVPRDGRYLVVWPKLGFSGWYDRDVLTTEPAGPSAPRTTGQPNEIVGLVSRMEDAIVSLDATKRWPFVSKRAKYGTGRNMTRPIGFSFQIQDNGVTYSGSAKSAGDIVRAKRVPTKR